MLPVEITKKRLGAAIQGCMLAFRDVFPYSFSAFCDEARWLVSIQPCLLVMRSLTSFLCLKITQGNRDLWMDYLNKAQDRSNNILDLILILPKPLR